MKYLKAISALTMGTGSPAAQRLTLVSQLFLCHPLGGVLFFSLLYILQPASLFQACGQTVVI